MFLSLLIFLFQGWTLQEIIKWIFTYILSGFAIDTLEKYKGHYARTLHAFLVKDMHFPEGSVPTVKKFTEMIDDLIKELKKFHPKHAPTDFASYEAERAKVVQSINFKFLA